MAFLGTHFNENIDSESDNGIAIFHHHHHPTFDPNSPSYEEFFHGFISSLYGNEAGDTPNENGLTLSEEAYEGEEQQQQQPYTGPENWPSDHNFSSSGCWADLFPHGHGTFDNGYGSGLEKTEDVSQSEEQYDSYCEDMDEQPAYGYNPWSGWGSGSGYRERNNSYDSGYSQDGLGLCEAVFGYWPCLYQKEQKSSAEYEENEQRYGYTWNGLNGSPFVQ